MPKVQTRGHPDVFMIMDFVSPDSGKEYSEYVCGYMDRDEAIRKRINLEYSGYVGGYMDNPAKHKDGGAKRHSGLFNASTDSFSEEQKRLTKQIFDDAQENESPLWRPILSFKNSFLAEYGIYDPKSGWVDDARLRDLTRRSVAALLKNEGMQSSAVWAASIHYNTRSIHIHIAIVEPQPTREKIWYKGKLRYRSRLKLDTLRKTKSQMAHCIVDHAEEMKRLQTLTRETIIKGHRLGVFLEDAELRQKFLDIYHSLPPDKRLWKYNMNGISRQRPLIDSLTKSYIEHYHRDDYKKLIAELDKREAVYRTLYGEGKHQSYKDFKTNKIKDLYTRMGNSILTELRNYDRTIHSKQSHGQAAHTTNQSVAQAAHYQSEKQPAARSIRQRFARGMARNLALQQAMTSLRKAIQEDSEHWKAQIEYERMINRPSRQEQNEPDSSPDFL